MSRAFCAATEAAGIDGSPDADTSERAVRAAPSVERGSG